MSEQDNVVTLNPQGKESKGRDEVLLWVYFWPNGSIAQIDHKPERAIAGSW